MAGGLGGLDLKAPKATDATASVGSHDGGGKELRPVWKVLGREAVNTFDPGSHTQHTQTTNNTDRPNKARRSGPSV